MVEGITVLNEVAVNGVCPAGLVIFIFGAFMFVLSFVIEEPGLIGAGIFVGLIGFAGLCVCDEHVTTQIEALIPNNVSWTEIYDHYEVEERRGNIWILNVLEEHEEAVKENTKPSECSCCKK